MVFYKKRCKGYGAWHMWTILAVRKGAQAQAWVLNLGTVFRWACDMPTSSSGTFAEFV